MDFTIKSAQKTAESISVVGFHKIQLLVI